MTTEQQKQFDYKNYLPQSYYIYKPNLAGSLNASETNLRSIPNLTTKEIYDYFQDY